MVPIEMVPYLIEITEQTDRIGLVSHLVKTLNKFTYRSSVRFFDLRQQALLDEKQGKPQIQDVLVEPLSPESSITFPDTIPGLGKALRDADYSFLPYMRFATDCGERIVFSLIEDSKIHSILLLETGVLSFADETMVRMFWSMFINMERIIRAKDQDPLTGLLNRRSFDDTISGILEKSFRTSQINRSGSDGASLAVFDIDHFKRVNDTFGHAIGDEVLILFARQMERTFRVADVLYRFGGEEFLAILLDVDEEKAFLALERFRDNIATHHFPQVETVTVSIGFVMVNGVDFPLELIEKADKALYYSKEHGRNQVNGFDKLVREGALVEIERDTGEAELW